MVKHREGQAGLPQGPPPLFPVKIEGAFEWTKNPIPRKVLDQNSKKRKTRDAFQ